MGTQVGKQAATTTQGQQPQQGGGFDWLTGITSAIQGFNTAMTPQQANLPATTGAVAPQQGMSTGTIVGLSLAGLLGIGILVAIVAKD